MAISLTSTGLLFTGTNTPAQSSGSGTSNLLDDYEEGAWTSAYTATSCSFTMSNTTGAYTKIGRGCYISYLCVTAGVSLSGANHLKISGVPFTSNSPCLVSGLVAFNANFAGGGAQFVYLGSNENTLALYRGNGLNENAYSFTSPKTAVGMGNASNNNYTGGGLSYHVNV